MKYIVCDFETEDLHAAYTTECKIRCVGFYGKSYKAVVTAEEARAKLWELSDTHRIVFHNASFDLSVIKTHFGDELFNALEVHDTQLIAYCLNTAQKNSLDALAEKYLDNSKVKISNFKTVNIKKLAHRCFKDCKLTYELFQVLYDELTEDEEALQHYYDVELPYIKLVIEMQLSGLHTDRTELEHLDKVLHRLNAYIERKLHKFCYALSHEEWKGYHEYASMDDNGEWFTTSYSNYKGETTWWHTKLTVWNTNSVEQNCKVLKKLYPRVDFGFRQTKDGKDTVDVKELQTLASFHKLPVLQLLAAKSKYAKLLEFTQTLSNAICSNSYIYANMNQCVTRTGRLSSSKPNLQNIPAREHGKKFRKLFTAPEGFKLVVGDLDRIELVVLAHYLETYGYSTYMADAIRAGQDLHQLNADAWQCERFHAKKVIFTLVYGSGDFKLAATLGVSLERAREIKQAIFKSTGLDEFREYVCRAARRAGGMLHDIMGRRLPVPEIMSNNNAIRAAGERRINNYLIQGSAGSIFKELQLRAKESLDDLPVRQCNVVHDEAIYVSPIEYAYNVVKVCNEAYTDDSILSVPIRATFKAGDSWYEAKT